jgi:hypothetical protein
MRRVKPVLATVSQRDLPENFEPAFRQSFQMLPEHCLPDGGCTGRSNFTKKDASGRTIEVQLENKCFYVKAYGPKKPYKTKAAKPDKSPHVSWATHGSVAAAWDAACALLGGWDPLQVADAALSV